MKLSVDMFILWFTYVVLENFSSISDSINQTLYKLVIQKYA